MKFLNALKSNKNSGVESVDKVEEIKGKSIINSTYYLKPNTEVAEESISEILAYNKIQYSQNNQGWIKCDLTLKLYNFFLSNSKKMDLIISNTEPISWN